MSKPIYSVSIPGYKDAHIDYKECGRLIDDEIKRDFMGKKVALRYLSTQDHPGKDVNQLIALIEAHGTDKYDPERRLSVAHDFYIEKGVDLFAVAVEVNSRMNVSAEVLEDFSEGALEDRGYSLRPDLVVVYDLEKLESILIQYDDGVGEDAFRFKDPTDKKGALLGFVMIF